MTTLGSIRLGAACAWLSLEWEPRDCWIGAYWTTKRGTWTTIDVPRWHWDQEWHLYVCLLPCLPLHLWLACRPQTTQEYAAEEP